MKSQHATLSSFLMTLLLAVLFSACGMFDSYDGRPDEEPVPQTRILRFELIPDTVATQDTVLIHCIIEDSLDERFKFIWDLEKERTIPVNGRKDGAKIRWIAPDLNITTGEVEQVYRGVTVDNGSEDSTYVQGSFEIPIIKQ